MRRSASEIIRNLEMRIARLEKSADIYRRLDFDREVFLEYAGRYIDEALKHTLDAIKVVEREDLIKEDEYGDVIKPISLLLYSSSAQITIRDKRWVKSTRTFDPRLIAMGITRHGGYNYHDLSILIKHEIISRLPRGAEDLVKIIDMIKDGN